MKTSTFLGLVLVSVCSFFGGVYGPLVREALAQAKAPDAAASNVVDLISNQVVSGDKTSNGALIFPRNQGLYFDGDKTGGFLYSSVGNLSYYYGVTKYLDIIKGSQLFVKDPIVTQGSVTFSRYLIDSGASGFPMVLQSGAPSGAGALQIDTAATQNSSFLVSFNNFGTIKAQVQFDGAITSTSTRTAGNITLAAGSGTATVVAGAHCACTDTTSYVSVKCAVASTTLTATGTGTDVISYVCL